MWKPIEIKPNDQSLIGKVIRYQVGPSYLDPSGKLGGLLGPEMTILHVGERQIFVRSSSV